MQIETAKGYIEYLEKENTILGVISTFCILVAGFILERIFSANEGYLLAIRENGMSFILLGSVLILYAAHRHFRQRSLIAWTQGQICLAIASNNKREIHYTIKDTDTRETWRFYNSAHSFVWTAFIEYLLSIASIEWKWSFFVENKNYFAMIIAIIPFIIMGCIAYEAHFLETRYPNVDSPGREFLKQKYNKLAKSKIARRMSKFILINIINHKK